MYNRSKAKGSRVEYEVRDYFRSIGFTADRVPASGAAQGFKGDVRVISPTGHEFVVEVKARKDLFKLIYAYLDNISMPLSVSFKGSLIDVSYDFKDLCDREYYPEILDTSRDLDRILKLRKFIQTCDYLVIKGDRKPLVFIRFQ
jgi:hypothetical protein